jgi:hypothetical protein
MDNTKFFETCEIAWLKGMLGELVIGIFDAGDVEVDVVLELCEFLKGGCLDIELPTPEKPLSKEKIMFMVRLLQVSLDVRPPSSINSESGQHY